MEDIHITLKIDRIPVLPWWDASSGPGAFQKCCFEFCYMAKRQTTGLVCCVKIG